ncbi:MAG: HNH endonuclease [Planctomycetota bacterium]|jgi:hypothetical protein
MITKKICIKCNQEKSVKQFSKNRAAKDGYQSCCKACAKIYKQTPRGKEVIKRYRSSKKNKEAQKRYWQSDKGKITSKRIQDRYRQTEKCKKRQKRFWQSDKGHQARKRSKATRRTNETRAGGSYSANEWYRLCEFYNFHCLKCNQKFPFNELTPDHVKPVSKYGSSFIHNIQPLCLECNRIKWNSEIDYRQTLPNWIKRDNSLWKQGRLF